MLVRQLSQRSEVLLAVILVAAAGTEKAGLTTAPNPVPVPGAFVLALTGFASLAGFRRRWNENG